MPLWWGYALVALLSISDPRPGIIGLISSVCHLGSPVLFRWTPRIDYPTHPFLIAGIAHQGAL